MHGALYLSIGLAWATYQLIISLKRREAGDPYEGVFVFVGDTVFWPMSVLISASGVLIAGWEWISETCSAVRRFVQNLNSGK